MIAFTLESIHICERRFLISQQCQRSIPWEQPRKELGDTAGRNSMQRFDFSILFPLLSRRLGAVLTPQELPEGQGS